MRKKGSPLKKKIGIGATIVATGAVAATLWLTSGRGQSLKVPAYSVIRVIDGDTFETAEHQHIRVAWTEAPELELCGGKEAKKALEKLVLDQPVYLKVIFRDPYQRLVSFVYTQDEFVNQAMLLGGYSYYLRGTSDEIGDELKSATEKARQKKAGIFSQTCTQMANTEKSSCNIKGNTRNGDIYYLPECGVYDNVEVQLYLGDRWFCNEKEAVAAGFRKPAQCP